MLRFGGSRASGCLLERSPTDEVSSDRGRLVKGADGIELLLYAVGVEVGRSLEVKLVVVKPKFRLQ